MFDVELCEEGWLITQDGAPFEVRPERTEAEDMAALLNVVARATAPPKHANGRTDA